MISNELNSVFQKALTYAKDQRHEYITIEHVFFALLGSDDGVRILKECGANVTVLRESVAKYLTQNMEPLPDEVEQEPFETVALSRMIDQMIRHIQSARKENASIGDLLAALFEEEQSYAFMLLEQQEISRLDILEIISHQDVDAEEASSGEESFLVKYTVDLIAQARQGKIDPVIGRADEIERVVQTLCRRKKNNPLFVGEPGVGKTAIAEGLALRIVDGSCLLLLRIHHSLPLI